MSGYEVDPAELFAARTTLDEAATEGRAELARLTAAAEDLLGHTWRGAAASAFTVGWDEWLGAARSVLAALEHTSHALGVTAAGYDDTEATLRTGFEAMAA